MDKGAHFYKCDFQVHSPRDINWTGERFGVNADQVSSLTDEEKITITNERRQFAREYLEKARQAGLQAIAITDHHDVVFAKIIRSVAQEEFGIIVFPGIELTLDTPSCQCIIIFDANFPDSDLNTVLNVFGIVPSNEFEKQTAQTVRISSSHVNDLVHLQKKLEDIPTCAGRYIILPNVSRGGTSTLLRDGAQSHYRKMPCVGGYVDKALSSETGWLNKLNGGDINYGNKAIGVLSTSDNRFEDGREFGKFHTWIKWSEPSAEALRQACLARQSRLSQHSPELPQIFITKLDVTNSKFLGSFSIEFNQQYNSLIGGRGTGKSTILEYLRWGLCDQTYHAIDTEDLGEIDRRRKSLIDKTLLKFSGEVRITFSLNGINHVVKRSSVSNEVMLKIDTAEFQKVSDEDIRRILPIQAYSQKQLSSVGVTTAELKRFIQSPILMEIGALDFQLDDNIKKTRSVYLSLLRRRQISKEIEQISLEITSLNDQVNHLRNSLAGMSPEDQALIARKPVVENEAIFISGVQRELNNIYTKVTELETSFQNYPEPFPALQFENKALIESIYSRKNEKVSEVKALITQLKESLSAHNISEIKDLLNQWKQLKDNFDSLYEIAKSKTTSNQQQLNEILRIETRLGELKNNIAEREDAFRSIGDPNAEFELLRDAYWSIHRKKALQLDQQAQKFAELSKRQIRVDVLNNLDLLIIKNEISRVLQGTRIQAEKVQDICNGISESTDPLLEWDAILKELRVLAELDIASENNIDIPPTPKLLEVGLNTGNIRRIAEVLSTDNWLLLSTLRIEFSPDFKYSTNNQMEDVIPFSEASAGQQATALLTVLLNQPGAPLIIDQPEDDIDNRAIDEIIKNIWEAKKHRQLIFTSHNANLVVNGDAELVICCDYRESGSQTRGIIKTEGAIDSKEVRAEITAVMEGGEKAFKLRKDKYGF